MLKLKLNERAVEGERLCKLGDYANGIKCFDAALQYYDEQQQQQQDDNDDDDDDDDNSDSIETILSIIYNQMGNAYFNMQEYAAALACHRRDLELCEQIDDETGKAKACGNIGNALQWLGEYDEAILFLLRNLDISRRLNDTLNESRALYNLANTYQSKGKFMGRLIYNEGNVDPTSGEFNKEIRDVLNRAIAYYRETLALVADDTAAQGRTLGNMGNTYYFLGEFESAIECHTQRLSIARSCSDRAAQRRAYSNLGNACVFQGNLTQAVEHYTHAIELARQLDDQPVVGQCYYSLGNVYMLMQDYTMAIELHENYLHMAERLADRGGQMRALWSLSNAYASLGDMSKAMEYANAQLDVARTIGDAKTELAAKRSLCELRSLIMHRSQFGDSESQLFTPRPAKTLENLGGRLTKCSSIDSFYSTTQSSEVPLPSQRSAGAAVSAAESSILQVSADESCCSTETNSNNNNTDRERATPKAPPAKSSVGGRCMFRVKGGNDDHDDDDEFSFFDILSRIQSNRLDDQRCATISATKAASSRAFGLNRTNNHQQQHFASLNDICSATTMTTTPRVGSAADGSCEKAQKSRSTWRRAVDAKPPRVLGKEFMNMVGRLRRGAGATDEAAINSSSNSAGAASTSATSSSASHAMSSWPGRIKKACKQIATPSTPTVLMRKS